MSLSFSLRRLRSLALGAVVSAQTSVVLAQVPAPPASSPAPAAWAVAPPAPISVPADIVRLKNNGFFRGVLLELEPGVRAVIQTDTGRRELPWSEIAYAGPASRDPFGALATPPPTVTSPAPIVVPLPGARSAEPLVELRSNLPDVQFFLWVDSSSYARDQTPDFSLKANAPMLGTSNSFRPLCTAPCSARLREGTQRLALARPGEGPVLLKQNVDVRAGVALQADYKIDGRGRALPVFLVVGGSILVVGGFALTVFGLAADGDGELALPIAAGVAGIGGVVAGTVLMPASPSDPSIRAVPPSSAIRPGPSFSAIERAPRMLGPTFGGTF